ncbi:hypothetical protein BN971_04912 [Mycobacterium bohemicum DSM 44277]|uniref:Uncharacterized protein n=1 Tax=Mycobacterium bohemicum DSM 44277 TaxID=1236609 RepID=A0A0U0WF41_MYCBE|nr:hypothetical protein BN971_04912 [Mycobacterium bohemicum DSM 44277]
MDGGHRAVAVGQRLRLGVSADVEVGGSQHAGVQVARGRIQRVGQGRRRRREQRRVRRRQCRSPGQRHVRFLGNGHLERGRRLQRGLEGGDVGPAADQEDAVGPRSPLAQAGHHGRQLRGGVVRELVAVQVGDRAVGHLDDGQRRVARFDEKHRDALVADGLTDRLRERRPGQQRGDQHDGAEVVGGDRLAQAADHARIGPRHAGRRQLVAAGAGAFPCPADRRDHLVDGARTRLVGRGDPEFVLFDGDAVGVLAFDEDQADGFRGHRHPKHHVHSRLPRS